MDLDAEPSPPTAIHLPPSLPYPITLTSLFTPVSSQVTKGTKALSYTYTLKDDLRDGADVNTTDSKKRKGAEKGFATWEVPIDGEVSQWAEGVKVGSVIKNASQPIIYIQQPCAHPVQFHGMCAICGADLASEEYTTPSTSNNSARNANPAANQGGGGNGQGGVEIEHNESGVKVSFEKAHSLALTHRKTLLSQRKLILIIDLDQTIIQTGCDLTTGRWMDECWGPEWGLVNVDSKGRGVPRTDGRGPHDPKLQEEEKEEVKEERKKNREENPNAAAIRDIWRFRMNDEDEVGVDAMGRKWVRKGRQGVWFYVKPRPGLQDFLTKMSEMYELHVYTAGTRTYANAICTCIDPTGKFFSERILSRNESGSASTKSLKRLFPTDESMVVVIDDRWEVWAHGRNLVKVIPYAFYPNTGDINSAFVEPRATDIPTDTPPIPPPAQVSEKTDDPELEKKKQQSEAAAREVEIQVAEAPLAKRQEELDRQGAEGIKDAVDDVEMLEGKGVEEVQQKRAALVDNDRELKRVDRVLNEIHGRFYQAFDGSDKRVSFRPASEPTNSIPHDVRHIIPHMRRKVLGGCVICFSGIIPLNQRPEDNEFWLLASMFGARCQSALDKHVTHLVTAQADTQKVGQALRISGTKVVWREWLRFSVDFCVRQPEEPYQIKSFGRTGGSPPRTPSRKGKEREKLETAVITSPPTPDVAERIEPVAVSAGDFDDIDAELEEFMGSDDDDDDDESMEGSQSGRSELSAIASPTNRKRPRKTHMDENATPQEQYDSGTSDSEDGKMAQFSPETGMTNLGRPVTKRARHDDDEREEHANQYDDVTKGQVDEDWDEYVDEGNASELDDKEEYEANDPSDDEDSQAKEATMEKASMT